MNPARAEDVLMMLSVDTIGVHYSATIWRWYRNWLANEADVTAKYGLRWFKVS